MDRDRIRIHPGLRTLDNKSEGVNLTSYLVSSFKYRLESLSRGPDCRWCEISDEILFLFYIRFNLPQHRTAKSWQSIPPTATSSPLVLVIYQVSPVQ